MPKSFKVAGIAMTGGEDDSRIFGDMDAVQFLTNKENKINVLQISAVCNNCGKTFAVVDIGTRNTAGGCWPGYLPHEIQGDNIVLKNSDPGSGKYRFD